MKKTHLFLIALFVIFIAAIFYTPLGSIFKDKIEDKSHVAGLRTLSDEDFDVELTGYNGAENTNLKELKSKNKVVFINYWGSWCPPCVEEMPTIQNLYNNRKNDVEFVLIAIQDKPKNILNFATKHQLTMPLYEPASPLSEAMLPKVFPTTYILNKKGEIVLHETKTRDWNDDEINDLIDQLLKE
ncbi:TlpA family protein disulfide reductase [Vaginella massiliensis]|uniref:TlpA family protein disulfide reductase n=1 Tax=Vaginella massiliensis TaxID=1816680 RepID=UPI00083854CA|nr:TlpA disulfide reductase family protein [Vaginella massiliensis]